MISWQQLKLLRAKSSRGRKTSWFKKLEVKLIEDLRTRKLKTEFMLPELNDFALEVLADKFSEDKRRKDWVVLRSTKGKEPAKLIIRRVLESTEKQVLTEHWQKKHEIEMTKHKLTRCKGCRLNQDPNQNECKKWSLKKEIQGSVSRYMKKEDEDYT